ncbi:hypothetical protein [Ottowia testudinis]|uniref:DUF3311 domain-containing protein n=1 Tax=Ottowia testudinis TaxID=2816950 RepID=A0A975CHM1_9BURK|nr:hypothetical protein [Ottowia testudinis]QTD45942.1 hypothetical protein J1M35_03220 [Ottowia testudinis]
MANIKLSERLLGLFVLGWLLLNFPLFSIWDKDALVFGWPLLPAAAFAIWLFLIVVLAVLMEKGGHEAPETPGTTERSMLPEP